MNFKEYEDNIIAKIDALSSVFTCHRDFYPKNTNNIVFLIPMTKDTIEYSDNDAPNYPTFEIHIISKKTKSTSRSELIDKCETFFSDNMPEILGNYKLEAYDRFTTLVGTNLAYGIRVIVKLESK